VATERERYELPPALAASGAGRGRSGFEDGFEPTDSPAVPSKGRSRTCPACGEDRLLRPTATERRNQLIREALAAGHGVREVARAVGLNHTTVLNIQKPKQRGTT
jgi:hypothetical protein